MAAAYEGDVELPATDGICLLAARDIPDRDINLRAGLFEAVNETNQELAAERCADSDAKLVVLLASPRGGGQGFFETIIMATNAINSVPAFRGQPDASVVAMEDLNIELPFDGTNVPAYGRFVHPKGPSHAAHAAHLRDRQRVFEMTK